MIFEDFGRELPKWPFSYSLQPSKVIEILLSREPTKGFYDVSCCYFTPLEVLHIQATFLC